MPSVHCPRCGVEARFTGPELPQGWVEDVPSSYYGGLDPHDYCPRCWPLFCGEMVAAGHSEYALPEVIPSLPQS